MVSRDDRKIACPKCGVVEEVSEETFDKMMEFPWINYTSGMPISIPLKCPHCGHVFRKNFIFTK